MDKDPSHPLGTWNTQRPLSSPLCKLKQAHWCHIGSLLVGTPGPSFRDWDSLYGARAEELANILLFS